VTLPSQEILRFLKKRQYAGLTPFPGEENFARALTLEDFNFLFSDSGEE
jgi:hypothetical protein